MITTIRSNYRTALISPNQQHRFDISALDKNNKPVPDYKLSIQLSDQNDVKVMVNEVITNKKGHAFIEIQAGAVPEKVKITARCENAIWEGILYVADNDIEYPLDLQLREIDETLIKMLYWSEKKLRVLREFGGGLSGSRVLQVQAIGDRGVFLTQIVKIGPRDEMNGEKNKYETFFMNRLPNAAPIPDYAELGLYAAIIYGDANAAQCLEPVKPFKNYFTDSETYHISTALSAVLKRGLRAVYRYNTVKNLTYKSILGKFLPENLVVSLSGGEKPYGVFQPGHEGDDITKLSPHDVERLNFNLSPGDAVLLRNFPISKMQDGDLNLEDTRKEHYKVKVKYDGAEVTDFTTGDQADVVAKYVTDRESRLQFALAHCLNRHGFKESEYGYAFSSQNYQDPLNILKSILEKPCDIAWGTIHGDLHWDNVMIESPSNWWLIDYGLTGDGPILFDFIKLELYLRITVLAKMNELTPEMILEFEHALVENPFGYPADTNLQNTTLNKALQTIQNIRRLAKPYFIDDFFEYQNMLFVYSLGLLKYYPTQDKWEAAANDTNKTEQLNFSSRQTFFSLAVAINVGRVLHWEKLSHKAPQLNLEFVTLGEVLKPESNKIILDVGSRCEPGIIDHHFKENIKGTDPKTDHSTTSLVWKKPGFITDHLGGTKVDDVTWVVHAHPDFDCIASTYLAWHIQKMGFFPPGANQLQQYSVSIDAGAAFLETVPFPEKTPYALFDFHLPEPKNYMHLNEAYKKRMTEGFALMNYFCRLEALGIHTFANNTIPQDHEYWHAIEKMGQDQDVFKNFDEKVAQKLTVTILVDGIKKQVNAIVLESPRSRFFKAWARKAGYPLMIVRWPQPEKPDHRIVVSVPPAKKFGLKGLGAALEKAESQKRKKMNKMRPAEPKRWPDVDNSDPWYDGRSPIHAYTIVDSPREGTVLGVEEVVRILGKGKWGK